MKKVRGIIALLIAITMGLVAVKAVSYYLKKPAQIKTSKVVQKKSVQGLFADIPVEMRVVNIKVDDVSGVSRKIKKGDMVDVIATTPLPEAENGKISRVILKRVKVHNVAGGDVEIAKRLITQKKTWTVSLLLDVDNAAMLTAAAKESDITLMMRNKSVTADHENREEDNAGYIFTRNTGTKKITGEEANLSASIPYGMRAVSIEINDTDGICGTIRPGDHVDVIISCKLSKVASGTDITAGGKGTYTEYRMHSRILLQDVKVLATENSIKAGGNLNRPVKLATLLVSAQDAVTLTAATDTSKKNLIKLVKRKSNDFDKPKTQTVYLDEILTQKKSYREKVHVIKGVNTEVFSF